MDVSGNEQNIEQFLEILRLKFSYADPNNDKCFKGLDDCKEMIQKLLIEVESAEANWKHLEIKDFITIKNEMKEKLAEIEGFIGQTEREKENSERIIGEIDFFIKETGKIKIEKLEIKEVLALENKIKDFKKQIRAFLQDTNIKDIKLQHFSRPKFDYLFDALNSIDLWQDMEKPNEPFEIINSKTGKHQRNLVKFTRLFSHLQYKSNEILKTDNLDECESILGELLKFDDQFNQLFPLDLDSEFHHLNSQIINGYHSLTGDLLETKKVLNEAYQLRKLHFQVINEIGEKNSDEKACRSDFRRILQEKSDLSIDAQFISLFIADSFAPPEYDGGGKLEIVRRLQTYLLASVPALTSFGISLDSIQLIKSSLDKVEFNVWKEKDLKSVILPKIQNLDFSTSFKDCQNSVLIYSGFKSHACLCEFIKIKLDINNHIDLKNGIPKLAFLVYNSGDGIQYHFQRQVNFRSKFSPLMIFVIEWDQVNTKFFENWLKFHLLFQDKENSDAKMYYETLFGGFNHVPFNDDVYDTFLQAQISGTCSVSCYHFYFSYKLGESKYNQIKSIMAAKFLYIFFNQTQFTFLGKLMIEMNNFTLNEQGFLCNSSPNNQSSSKFELPRWNINFFDWAIRLLFRWNSENFTKNPIMHSEFRGVIMDIYKQFKIKSKEFSQTYKYDSVDVFNSEFK